MSGGPWSQRIERRGNVELRYQGDVLDEIVIYDADGRCFFHLEQMHDNNYWMAFYKTALVPIEAEERLVVNFNSRLPTKPERDDRAEGHPALWFDTVIVVTAEFDA
jgi:hypothetical protein